MGYKFNRGNGAYLCDKCSVTILNYLPHAYLKDFYVATKTSRNFKGMSIWAAEDKRFCSATCMKEFNNEDSSLANAIYDDRLYDS